ncbi:MAG: site-specific integrase [Desulfobacterales bacterium]
MPALNNEKTEDLTPEQLSSLLAAMNESENQDAADMMRLALYTGMRRGEIFRLKWADIDFERGFIRLRDPKGGRDEQIPLNSAARQLLETHSRTASEYAFPGRGGGQRTCIKRAVNRIKEAAGLPKSFRAMHGLRHVFASALASSGKVDLYVLQRLLTHKSATMTARYSHLRDEALRGASELAGEIVTEAAEKTGAAESQKVASIEDHRK